MLNASNCAYSLSVLAPTYRPVLVWRQPLMNWKSVACIGSVTRMPSLPEKETYSIPRARSVPGPGTLTVMRKKPVAAGIAE